MLNVAEACLKTVALYAAAEAQAQHATKIEVRILQRGFTVADNGRGHAPGRTLGSIPYLKFIYQQHAFGSFAEPKQEIQLQGLGSSLVASLCQNLTVTSSRNGRTEVHEYEYGKLVRQATCSTDASKSGNTITASIAADEALCEANVRAWLTDLAGVIPYCTFYFNGDQVEVKTKDSGA